MGGGVKMEGEIEEEVAMVDKFFFNLTLFILNNK